MLYEAHGISRFVVICGYTDLRKGVGGLAQLLEGTYHLDPFEENVLFLFCGRRGDRIKALLWKGDGFLLLYKRWEKGSLSCRGTRAKQPCCPSTSSAFCCRD